MDEQELEKALEREMEQQAGEGEDFYYTTDEYAQVRTESLIPQVVSEEVSFHILILIIFNYELIQIESEEAKFKFWRPKLKQLNIF